MNEIMKGKSVINLEYLSFSIRIKSFEESKMWWELEPRKLNESCQIDSEKDFKTIASK